MKVYLADPRKENEMDSVVIHDYDTWNMDSSLAKIILPMLEEYASNLNGFPSCFNNIGEWVEVLDTMIYSFSQAVDCYPAIYAKDRFTKEKQTEIKERIKKIQVGFDNFGKYYMSLWD